MKQQVQAQLVLVAATLSSVAGALEPEQIFAKASSSVVVVVAYNSEGEVESLGSGVVIAKGEIATNCHVIKRAAQVWAKQGELVSQLKVRFKDQDRDLCQLTVRGVRSGNPYAG